MKYKVYDDWRKSCIEASKEAVKKLYSNCIHTKDYEEALERVQVDDEFETKLNIALARFSKRDREILVDYFKENTTFKNIGKKYNISSSTTGLIVNRLTLNLLRGSNVYLFSDGIGYNEEYNETVEDIKDMESAIERNRIRLIRLRREALRLQDIETNEKVQAAVATLLQEVKLEYIIDINDANNMGELFGARIANLLVINGIPTISVLLEKSDEQLLAIKNINWYSITKIDSKLNEFGLKRME